MPKNLSKHAKKLDFFSGANETPKKVMRVAIDLFASNGFKGTSIRDIAKLSGGTISNIYYYFGNKEGLLLAILKQASDQIVLRLRQVIESDLEPLERFKKLLKTHLALLIDVYPLEAKILFLDEEHLSRISKPFQIEILDMYRGELEELKSLGYLNSGNITLIAFNLFGVINWHLRWHKPQGPMSLEQICDEMQSFVLDGILKKPAQK
jgi:TetR/AcrR family transcriptional regulator, cholesterol catabolism regulator